MSGLAGMLAGRRRPGVYRWESALDVSDVEHAVQLAEWGFGYVDGWVLSGKAETLAAIGTALGFPSYYGRNLDALDECLNDLTDGHTLLWDGWAPYARADPRSFGIVLEILAKRAADMPDAPFVTLLRGDGPDLPGIELLD